MDDNRIDEYDTGHYDSNPETMKQGYGYSAIESEMNRAKSAVPIAHMGTPSSHDAGVVDNADDDGSLASTLSSAESEDSKDDEDTRNRMSIASENALRNQVCMLNLET